MSRLSSRQPTLLPYAQFCIALHSSAWLPAPFFTLVRPLSCHIFCVLHISPPHTPPQGYPAPLLHLDLSESASPLTRFVFRICCQLFADQKSSKNGIPKKTQKITKIRPRSPRGAILAPFGEPFWLPFRTLFVTISRTASLST